MNKLSMLALFCSVSLLRPLLGAELGMQAPELKVKDWVKGGPISLPAPPHNAIYVLWFFETGCQQCLQILPELSALHFRFKDQGLVLVGISTEPPALIKDYIA